MTCPNCQAQTGPKDHFCARCGATLASPGGPIAGSAVGPPPAWSGSAQFPAAPAPDAPPPPASPWARPVDGPPRSAVWTQPVDAPPPPSAAWERSTDAVPPAADAWGQTADMPPSPRTAWGRSPDALPPATDAWGGPAAVPPLPATPWSPPVVPVAGPRRGATMGVLAVTGAAVLLLLAVAAIWLVSGTPRAAVPLALPSGAVPTPRMGGYTPTTDAERAVIAAVAANNTAQIIALRTLDPSVLDGKMTGTALTDNQQMVSALRQQGAYQDAHLLAIDYAQPRFLTGDQASIRTVEQWQSSIRQQGNGAVVQTQPPQTLHEIYYLSRQGSGWVVNQVTIQEDQPGTPLPQQ